MYVRFTTPGAVTRAGVRPGFFGPAYQQCRARWPEPVAQALDHELWWFERFLPVPRGDHPFAVRAQKVWHRDGVCWFRPDAHEAISHGHVMAALLEECGVPVTQVTVRHPGTILYRDDLQVVAKPN